MEYFDEGSFLEGYYDQMPHEINRSYEEGLRMQEAEAEFFRLLYKTQSAIQEFYNPAVSTDVVAMSKTVVKLQLETTLQFSDYKTMVEEVPVHNSNFMVREMINDLDKILRLQL